MAHEIMIKNGVAQYASTQQEWHFGETKHAVLRPGASIEEWAAASGLDYRIQRAVVRYATDRYAPDTPISKLLKMEDKVVLFRHDTGAALGLASDNYQIVQPIEGLEMFREWAQAGGVVIESAGVLFGGKRYFATAKLSEAVCVDGTGDKIILYALFSTSADGSLATEVRLMTVRVVCNNTLRLAMAHGATYRATHRTKFDAESAKAAVEQANAEFGSFMQMSRTLAGIKVHRPLAEDLTMHLFKGNSTDTDKVRESRGFTRVMELFNGAAKGAQLETARETAWGWLNAVTEYTDHHVRAHNAENRIASALWGPGDALKNKAVELALAAA